MAKTIEGTGRVVGEEIELPDNSPQQAFDELDDILNADFCPETPNAIKELPSSTRKSPGYKYYQKIVPLLPEWWEEFNTALSKKGGPKYRGIRAFAQEKSNNRTEEQYIVEMLGSKPMIEENGLKNARVPWLGNWEHRRSNSWNTTQNSKKMAALQRAIKEKVVAWDAVRSSAPFLVQELASWVRLSEKVDRAFGGEPFDAELSPTDPDNVQRYRLYFQMKKELAEQKKSILESWAMVHGVNPKDPQFQMNMNTVFAQIGTPGGISDPNSANPPAIKELALLQLAQHLQNHAENFDMPLPEAAFPTHHAASTEKHHKGNGKVQ